MSRCCTHDHGRFTGLTDDDGRAYLWCGICGAIGFGRVDDDDDRPLWLYPQHARGFDGAREDVCDCGTCEVKP